LLRAIQENEIQRVGGSKEIIVDVRVIAATNRDLVSAMEKEHSGTIFITA
jgi:transcriptional regulator with GAF, ATPase, and Fis domain